MGARARTLEQCTYTRGSTQRDDKESNTSHSDFIIVGNLNIIDRETDIQIDDFYNRSYYMQYKRRGPICCFLRRRRRCLLIQIRVLSVHVLLF